VKYEREQSLLLNFNAMKKILLIEDNKDISRNIKEYLELEGYLVEVAYDGEVWIDKATEHKYDLILLDLMLPKIDGFTIAKKLQRRIKTPIIMTTAKDSIDDKLLWFESGALDYIVKPFDLRELEVRINILLKRNQNTHDIIEFEDVEIHLEKREFKKSDTLVNITQKEFLIFEYLYKNNSRVVTRTELIEHIWWENWLFESDSKLDVYISNLRKKLCKNIIETVKGVGYKIGVS